MQDFSKQLDALKDKGRYRSLALPAGVDLTSNDYLGLARSDALRARALEYLAEGGAVGAAGSRLLRGHMDEHESLEAAAAAFFGCERALYFSSGFQANLAVFGALCGRADVVIYDELLHASARDGIKSCDAKGVRVRHNDLQAFEDALKASPRRVDGRVWVAVESLYSMDGDVADVAALYALCQRYDAWLIVDEAHATGVCGDDGEGLCLSSLRAQRSNPESYEYGSGLPCRVAPRNDGLPENVITVHTCGKALGVAGGLVCGSADVIEMLVNKARPFIYSTAPLPLQAVLVEEALRLVGSDDGEARRTSLRARCVQARTLFGGAGTHVVPIMIGDDVRAVEIAAAVQEAGYDIRAIRPPTVAEGTARLRLSLSSDLKESDLAGFADIIRPLLNEETA